jgi:hypothetical protein
MDQLGCSHGGAPRSAEHAVPAARHSPTTSRRPEALPRQLEPLRPLTRHPSDTPPRVTERHCRKAAQRGEPAGWQPAFRPIKTPPSRRIDTPPEESQISMTPRQKPCRSCVERASNMRQDIARNACGAHNAH